MTIEEIEEGRELRLQFDKRGGFLPVTVQESKTGKILMMATINKEAFEYTVKNKQAAFWSTSRNILWVKGQTSGDTLTVNEIWVDCDQDAVIYIVDINGSGVCHTYNEKGIHRKSCFYRQLNITTGTLNHKAE